MSSISNVSSTINPYQTQPQNNFAQMAQAFKAIGSALQSGNLSSAQSALATFQQALGGSASSSSASSSSSSSTNQPFGSNSQANTAYQSLISSLQSGNVSGAQSAYNNLQDGLKSSNQPAQAQRAHHHHGSGTATDASSAAAATSGLSYTADDEESAEGGLNVTA